MKSIFESIIAGDCGIEFLPSPNAESLDLVVHVDGNEVGRFLSTPEVQPALKVVGSHIFLLPQGSNGNVYEMLCDSPRQAQDVGIILHEAIAEAYSAVCSCSA